MGVRGCIGLNELSLRSQIEVSKVVYNSFPRIAWHDVISSKVEVSLVRRSIEARKTAVVIRGIELFLVNISECLTENIRHLPCEPNEYKKSENGFFSGLKKVYKKSCTDG